LTLGIEDDGLRSWRRSLSQESKQPALAAARIGLNEHSCIHEGHWTDGDRSVCRSAYRDVARSTCAFFYVRYVRHSHLALARVIKPLTPPRFIPIRYGSRIAANAFNCLSVGSAVRQAAFGSPITAAPRVFRAYSSATPCAYSTDRPSATTSF